MQQTSLFGLTLDNLARDEAVRRLLVALDAPPGTSAAAWAVFVNAHAARLAADDPAFHAALGRADWRLADGIGVRLALLMRGVRLCDNLVGTDFVPALMRAAGASGRERRCFLLGGEDATNRAATVRVGRAFPGWWVAGRHHGFVGPADDDRLVDLINASGAELLLIGMGNPLQERWLERNAARLDVRLALAVGGLFSHWSGELVRASPTTRRLGLEWVQLSLQQPARFRRYARDIPSFLARAIIEAVRQGRGDATDRAARPHLA